MSIKILLIDDEKAIAETLIAYANRENMSVSYAENGQVGMDLFAAEKFDVIILDWMLPGLSGPEIITMIRQKSSVPILMISARDDESDIVIGLNYGADDYLTKPFGPRELIARVKSLARRAQTPVNGSTTEDVQTGNLRISFGKRSVWKDGEPVTLTMHEFRILAILVQHDGEVVTRERLMEDALDYKDFTTDRTLDTHIKNLRKKIEDPQNEHEFIQTVRGVGFKFVKKNEN